MPFNVSCKDCLFNVANTCRRGSLQNVRTNFSVAEAIRGTQGRTHGGHDVYHAWPKIPDDSNAGCSAWEPDTIDFKQARIDLCKRTDPTEDMIQLLEKLVAMNPGARIAEFLDTIKNNM